MSGSGKLTHDLFDPVASKPKTTGFQSLQVMEVNSIGGQGSFSSMINSFKESQSGSGIFNTIDLSGVTSNILNLHTDDLITVSYQQIQYNKDASDNYYVDDVTYGQLKWVGKVVAIDNDNSKITISTEPAYKLTDTIIQTLTNSGYNNTDAQGTSSNFLLYDYNNGTGAKELKATYNNTNSGESTITTYFFFQKRGGAVNMNAGLMITKDDLTSNSNDAESLIVAGDVILGNDTDIDRVTVNAKTSLKSVTTLDSTLYVEKTSTFKGTVSLDSKLDVAKSATLNNTLYVNGASTMNAAVSLKNTLDVENAVTMDSTLFVGKSMTVNEGTNLVGTLDVSGATTVDQTLYVGKTSKLVGAVSLDSTLFAGGATILDGAVSVKDTLDIVKAVTMDSTLFVGKTSTLTGAVFMKNTLDIEKAVTMDSTLYVAKNLTLGGNISSGDHTYTLPSNKGGTVAMLSDVSTISGSTTLESKLNVKGAATFDSTVYVEGFSHIKGAVSMKDILDVEKAATFDSTLFVGKSLTVEEGTNLAGTLDVSGATTVDQTLYVGKTSKLVGAVSLTDTLDVEKASTFDSTLLVGKSLTVKEATILDGTLDVSGAVTLDKTLHVAEIATLKGATSIEGILDVSGATTLDSSLTVGKTATVIGYTSLENKLNVKGAATFDSTVYVEGFSHIKGAVSMKDILDVEKATTFDSTLFVGKSLTVNEGTNLAGTLDVSGATTVDQTLYVGKTSKLVGAVSLDSTLFVGGATILDGAVSLTNTLEVEKASTFDSTLYVGKSMTVKEATSLDGTLDVSGAVTIDKTLYVGDTVMLKKATSIEGILDVSGSTTLHGTLDVSEAATFYEALTVAGNTEITGNLVLGGSLSDTGGNFTLSTTELGYLDGITSSIQSQLNALKYTVNKRMYVNDQTEQSEQYVLTINNGSSDVQLAHEYTPNLFAKTNIIDYTQLDGQVITFRGRKLNSLGSDQTLLVDFGGCTSTDAVNLSHIVDETGSNNLTGRVLDAGDISGNYGIHPLFTSNGDISSVLGYNNLKGASISSSTFVASGVTITMNSATASGKSIRTYDGNSGAYNITINVNTSSVNLSNIGDANATTVINVKVDSVISSFPSSSASLTVKVSNNVTLSTTKSEASGLTIQSVDGETGTLKITDDASDCDFTNISTNVQFGENTTFTGTLVNGRSYEILDGKTFTADAVEVSTMTMSGAGSLTVTNMSSHVTGGKIKSDFSNITTTTVTATIDVSSSDMGISSDANFGDFVLTVSGNNILTADAGATLTSGTGKFIVGSGSELEITALHANGLTVEGQGTVSVTNLEDTPGADLSSITTSEVTATMDSDSGSQVITGNLGVFEVIISGSSTITANAVSATLPSGSGKFVVEENATLQLAAQQATGLTVTGDGTTAITALNDDADAALANINSTTVTIAVSDNVTFTGTFPSSTTATTTVAAGKTLTLTASLASGETITGAGNTTINTLTTNAVLVGITTTGTNTVNTAGNITFTGSFPAEAFKLDGDNKVVMNANSITKGKTMTIESLNTLESTAANLTGKTITGAGTTTITALNADPDSALAGVNSNIVTIAVSDDVTFTGTFPSLTTATTTVAVGKTLTLTAVLASGQTITGSGNITINTLTAAAALVGITTTGTNTVNTAAAISFTGTFPAEDFTLDGNNKVTMEANSIANGKTMTIAGSNTLESTAAYLANKTITGAGTTTITALNADPDSALAGVNSNIVTIAVSDDLTFTGTFPSSTASTTTVAVGKTLTLTATLASGKIITGAGDITLTDTVSNDQKFGGISSSGAITFVGGTTPETMPSTFVNNGELTIEAAVLTGKTVTGTGAITLTDVVSNDQKFGGISSSGDITFVGGTTPETMPSTFVNNTTELTIEASVITGKTVTGSGSISIADLHSTLAADLSNITADTITAAFNDTGVFTGTLSNGSKNITINIADGKTLETSMRIAAEGKVIFNDGGNSGTLQLNVSTNANDLNKDLTTASVIDFSGMNEVFVHIDETLTMHADAKFFSTPSATRKIKVADSVTFTATTTQIDGQFIGQQGSGTTKIIGTDLQDTQDLDAANFAATEMEYKITDSNTSLKSFTGTLEGSINKQIEIHYGHGADITFYVAESAIPNITQDKVKWCGQSGDVLFIQGGGVDGKRVTVDPFSNFGADSISVIEIKDEHVTGTPHYIMAKTAMTVTHDQA